MGACWSLLGTSSQCLSSARWPSPIPERVRQLSVPPREEGPGARTAGGGLLQRLPYCHRRRLCGDLEGLSALLQGVGDQAEVAQAVFLEVHRDGACRAHEGGAEKPDGTYLSARVAAGDILEV